MLVQVAQSGVFNKPNKTPLDSAKESNLYECFHFLNTNLIYEYSKNK